MEKRARDKLTELGLMTIQNISQAVETLSGGQRQAWRWRAPPPSAPRW
jgi:fructose transport system ATP-binding protein